MLSSIYGPDDDINNTATLDPDGRKQVFDFIH